MNMPEALKLVPIGSQPAGYLVTYASGDTAFFERLPESLPAGCLVQELPPIQEGK